MAGNTVKVLCGSCKVGLEGPANAKDHDVVACPRCGRSDTLKNVMREVTKHAEEVTARSIQKSLSSAFSGSKNTKVTHNPIPHRSYRFISDLKL
ncbi:hypothetical protein [Mesorhizobium silamurunense]|uniref:hypothetical protein n=1 Tax=Mesorhizobium silamurunense TaxID=499528 RepID=UPI00177F6948|nr:hypothetical protein [Mesorhizobium silamurunense]